MKYFVNVLLLMCFSIGTNAQVDPITTTSTIERPNLILKWSPSPLISFTAPTVQFSVEYPMGKNTQRFYLEHDVGYVYANPNLTDEYSRGFRVATKVKYYFRSMDEVYDNFFISFMLRYTQRAEKGNRFFERAGGAFEQRFDYTKRNNYSAGYLELGYLGRFGASNRIIFEGLMSGGLSYYTNSFTGIPDDAVEPNNEDGWLNFRTDELLPSILIVLKFGYILK